MPALGVFSDRTYVEQTYGKKTLQTIVDLPLTCGGLITILELCLTL